MKDLKPYFDGEHRNHMDYSDFVINRELDDDAVLKNIQTFIKDQVKDILLIKITEDKLFLTPKELDKLPKGVRNFLRFSEHRGIKMYVFTTKDGGFRTAIGVFGGSTGRANEWYFDKIINDERYKDITTTMSVKLTDLFTTTH